MTLTEQLVAQALTLATDAYDDQAVAELRQLADGNDQAITACMAQPASLSARRRAIELLARALYEWFPPSRIRCAVRPTQYAGPSGGDSPAGRVGGRPQGRP